MTVARSTPNASAVLEHCDGLWAAHNHGNGRSGAAASGTPGIVGGKRPGDSTWGCLPLALLLGHRARKGGWRDVVHGGPGGARRQQTPRRRAVDTKWANVKHHFWAGLRGDLQLPTLARGGQPRLARHTHPSVPDLDIQRARWNGHPQGHSRNGLHWAPHIIYLMMSRLNAASGNEVCDEARAVRAAYSWTR